MCCLVVVSLVGVCPHSILLINLCCSCSKLIAIRTPNLARKALDRLLVPDLTQCLLHSRLLIREGTASVKCQMPPHCPLFCSSLGTQEPSALGAHIQLKSSPDSHAFFSPHPGVEPSLCLPPALLPSPQMPLHPGPFGFPQPVLFTFHPLSHVLFN